MTATRQRTFCIRYSVMVRGSVDHRASLHVRAHNADEALKEACDILTLLKLDLRSQITSIR